MAIRVLRLTIIFLWAAFPAPIWAKIHPQAGLQYTGGANGLSLFTPWAAARFGLSPNASFILKYYNHNLKYTYRTYDEPAGSPSDRERTASISNLTSVLYFQKNSVTAWSAVSFMAGTDAYKAVALDAGIGKKLSERLTLESGIYLIREDSVLWYPEDPKRKIDLFSVKAALKIKIFEILTLNPNIYISRNSEDVDALSYSLGFILTPFNPAYITAHYFRYSESARYKFAGDYIAIGLHFYY